jgi:hypothetical protein
MNKAISFLANLKAEATIISDLATAVTAFGVYEALAITNADALDPVGTANALRVQIGTETDSATRLSLMQQLAGYENEDAANSNRRAAVAALAAAYPAVNTTMLALLNQAITLATGYLETAVADENTLWDTWAAPETPTIISNRCRTLLASLESMLADETNWSRSSGGRLPAFTYHRVISFFS